MSELEKDTVTESVDEVTTPQEETMNTAPATDAVEENKVEEVAKTTTPQPAKDSTLDEEEENDDIEYAFQPRPMLDETIRTRRAAETIIPRIKHKSVIGKDGDFEDVIVTVRGTLQSVYAAMERVSESQWAEKSEEMAKWVALLTKAQQETALSDDQLYEATIRKGALWVNQVNFGTEEEPAYKGLASDRKGINPADKNDMVSIAKVKTLGALKLGTPSYMPLYHTGIWVRINVPTATAFVALNDLLLSEKIQYGARTRGEILNNESVLYRKHIANFILDHVDWSTAPSDDREYLKSIIKATDLDALMIACMQARYPDGYPYVQVCSVNPKECTHAEEGIIDLREVVFTDENKLTEKQRRLMQSPRKRLTVEQLAEYQEEFKNTVDSRIILTRDGNKVDYDNIIDGVVFNIESPTLEMEEDYGISWVNTLIRNAEEIFKEKRDEKARRARIEEQVLVSYFKTYGSWIKSVEVYESGMLTHTFQETEQLDQLFEYLSSENFYVEQFSKAIKAYITNNIVTVIGTLNYECPVCGGKHETPKGPHYLILPMDVLVTFFTLVRSSVRRSFQRSVL